jgi:hypothetical protein
MVRKATTATVLALGLACAALAFAPAVRAQQPPPAVDPEAARALTAALGHISGAKSFTFRAEVASDTPLPSGQKVQFPGMLEVAVRRPDGFWNMIEGEQRTARSWYDGKTFTLLNAGKNVYACWKAPERLEELFGTMREQLGFTPPLTPLLRENLEKTALAKVTAGFVVGRGLIGETKCLHLAFRGEKTDWQVWVAEHGEPLIKRIVITYKLEPGAPQYSATFLSWDFAPRLSDAVFAFTPPPGAVQCEFEPAAR